MAGPPPTVAKGPPTSSRPQTRSQSRPSLPPPSATSQKEITPRRQVTKVTLSNESSPQSKDSSSTPPSPQPLAQCRSPLSTIATGIHNVIEFYKPLDQVRLALAEILGYARKAVEEEAAKIAEGDKSTCVEDSLTKSTEQLGKAAECLERVAAEIQGKIIVVTNSTSQLESTANSYKDALLKIPSQIGHAREGQGETDPVIGRNVDRKSRQVLIDFSDDQMTTLSTMAIEEKILEATKKVSTTSPPPKDVMIEEVTKLRNNGIVILFKDKEVVDWLLQSSETELLFTSAVAMDSSIRPCQHIILVPKILITLDPANQKHISEIEEVNRLKDHSISKIRWIKLEKRRNPDQRLAHALFSLSRAEAANVCIRDRLLVHGIKVYPSKLKQEPTQCLKCSKWGHYVNQCLATKDTCSTCGGDHWTNACKESHKRYCAFCNDNSHASWDRLCPEFLKRCTQYDESHPENALKYFPTGESWTKVIRPAKIPFVDHFPVRFAVGSLPPPNRDKQRESPTRQIKQRRKRRTPTRAAGQTAITNFYSPSASQNENDILDADSKDEGEIDDFITAS